MLAFEILLYIVLPIAALLICCYFLVGFIVFKVMFLSQNKKVVSRSTERAGHIKDNPLASVALAEFDAAKRLFFTGEVSGSVQNLPDFMWAVKPQTISIEYLGEDGKTFSTSFSHFYAACDYEERTEYLKDSGAGSDFSDCHDSDKWVILVHGHGGSGRDNYKLSYQFMKRGYNVVALDLKGHGCDNSTYIDYGYSDRLAIKAWAKKISSFNKNAKIILVGVSMGASACLYSLGEDLPKNIVCVVCDSGFSSIYDVCLNQIKRNIVFVPPRLVLSAVNIFARTHLKLNLKKLATNEALKRNDGKVKALIFHGLLDRLIDVKNASIIYEALGASGNGNVMKIYENAGHLESMPLNFEDYFHHIDEFIRSQLI